MGYLLFHRDFRLFSGGHLKVWNYYQHARHSTRFEPRIYLTPASLQEPHLPWFGIDPPPLRSWQPELASLLFIAGIDWRVVPDPSPRPVINLIQGLRHADPADQRFSFLRRPAVRLCVSSEVAEAILATGQVNGPVHVIPNGLDLNVSGTSGPRGSEAADSETAVSEFQAGDGSVLIAGLKNPGLAQSLAAALAAQGIAATCLLTWLPRQDFLAQLARASVVVLLPLPQEGFFLPALEAMALAALIVCPDCVGNRSFCRDGDTCFRPDYSLDALLLAVRRALTLSAPQAAAIRDAARVEAGRHTLAAEREAFLAVLDSL